MTTLSVWLQEEIYFIRAETDPERLSILPNTTLRLQSPRYFCDLWVPFSPDIPTCLGTCSERKVGSPLGGT